MTNRKITNTYFFTVDGETELWYFEWLEKQINENPDAKYRVSLKRKKKTPLKYAKSHTVLERTEITHIFDFESEEAVHTDHFFKMLDEMKKSELLGKQIKYKSGYSNFTFELWMVLHKSDCSGSFAHRRQYLEPINRAYGEHFGNLDQYKHENDFKRVLGKLCLEDVKNAVHRAKAITDKNEENGYTLHEYKTYKYYRENPSLAIWETVERILCECGIMQ